MRLSATGPGGGGAVLAPHRDEVLFDGTGMINTVARSRIARSALAKRRLTEQPTPACPGPSLPVAGNRSHLELTPERIFREYAPQVYTLARHLLGNEADAEDVTQDVFVQLLRKLPTYRGEAAFPTWLHRVTVNAALAFRRKRAQREGPRVPYDSLADSQGESNHRAPVRRGALPPDQLAVESETHRRIEEAIDQLPDIYRDVFVLADVEGLAAADTAVILGLSVAAVLSRLHRARLLMRHALAPYFEEWKA